MRGVSPRPGLRRAEVGISAVSLNFSSACAEVRSHPTLLQRQDRAADWTSAGKTGNSFPDWTSVRHKCPDRGPFRSDSPNERPSEPIRRTRQSYQARAARKSDSRFFFCQTECRAIRVPAGRPRLHGDWSAANGAGRVQAKLVGAADQSTADQTAPVEPKTQTTPRNAWGRLVYIKQQLDAFITCHQATIPANGNEVVLTDSRPGFLRATCLSTFP